MTDRLLTVEQVAEQLQAGEETVRRYLRSDQLHGVKVGGQWRIRESELAKFVGNGKEINEHE